MLSAESKKVLVVDDDPDTTELTALVLTRAGYSVVQAHSGREALEKVHTEAPDLVLLDINMDDLDGWETLRLLRVDDDTRDLPVAMFSVRGEMREKVHGLQLEATDYITKPFEHDDLIRRVARIFESHTKSASESR